MLHIRSRVLLCMWNMRVIAMGAMQMRWVVNVLYDHTYAATTARERGVLYVCTYMRSTCVFCIIHMSLACAKGCYIRDSHLYICMRSANLYMYTTFSSQVHVCSRYYFACILCASKLRIHKYMRVHTVHTFAIYLSIYRNIRNPQRTCVYIQRYILYILNRIQHNRIKFCSLYSCVSHIHFFLFKDTTQCYTYITVTKVAS